MSDLVKIHIDRCVEIYGCVSDEEKDLRKASISRAAYEQMRTDLMLSIGMLSALQTGKASGIHPNTHPF